MEATTNPKKLLRERISSLIMRNFDRLQDDLDRMPERERTKAILDLMRYVIAPYKGIADTESEAPRVQMPTHIVFKTWAKVDEDEDEDEAGENG